jgi:hypothetical protein
LVLLALSDPRPPAAQAAVDRHRDQEEAAERSWHRVWLARARSAVLDRMCAEVGRDPAEIVRSLPLGVSYDNPDTTRKTIAEALDAGFRHFVLSVPPPYPDGVARWVAEELIAPSV